jgi:hypothetical protein
MADRAPARRCSSERPAYLRKHHAVRGRAALKGAEGRGWTKSARFSTRSFRVGETKSSPCRTATPVRARRCGLPEPSHLVRGRDFCQRLGEVEPIVDRLSESVSDGQPGTYEVLGAGVSGDLGYVAAIERSVAGTRGWTPQTFTLGVTTIFRREAGDWRVVHRHGDPSTPRRVNHRRAKNHLQIAPHADPTLLPVGHASQEGRSWVTPHGRARSRRPGHLSDA